MLYMILLEDVFNVVSDTGSDVVLNNIKKCPKNKSELHGLEIWILKMLEIFDAQAISLNGEIELMFNLC